MADPVDVSTTKQLSPPAREDVLALVGEASRVDGTSPLSEQSLLAIRGRSSHHPTHLLAYAGARLLGYAQLDEDSAELVVAPDARRKGVGTAVLERLPPDSRVWAHGDRPDAKAFAAARGLHVVRELWMLGRRVDENPALADVVLPDGLVARAFEPGRDEDEWLRVNAAAFAHHAEQGRMTRDDLDARMAEPWFEAAGLILVVPENDPHTVAASHWTKIPLMVGGAHGSDAPRRGGTGEVYVVAVDPAYQGRGLGKPVTLLGLHHLQERGVEDVVLYVDGDNTAAMTVYRKLGFETRSVDRMYAQ